MVQLLKYVVVVHWLVGWDLIETGDQGGRVLLYSRV